MFTFNWKKFKWGKAHNSILVITAGVALGYLRGRQKAQRDNKPYSYIEKEGNPYPSSFTKYECQDQVNELINRTQKPAVIYYYLSSKPEHYLFRHYMIKYSQIHQERAHWFYVSIRQNFQQIRKAFLGIKYPQSPKLEIRFPQNQILAIDGKEQMQYQGHRREVYNFDIWEDDFVKFLEFYGIISGGNPLEDFHSLTRKAIFEPMQ